MDESSVAVRWYIAGLSAISTVVVGLCLAVGSAPSVRSRPVLAAALAAGAMLAQFFPIHLADKTKVYVDSAVVIAAVLLLSPAAAVGLAVVAVGVHQIVRREDWDQTVFNVAQTALHVGAGALVFRALGPAGPSPEVPGIGSWLGVVAAIGAMHLLNTLGVAIIAALQLGNDPLRVWREEFWLDFPEHLVLVALGVLLALLAGDRPWLLSLAVPPVALVYASLRRGAEVRAAGRAAEVATGDLLDLLTQAPRGHSRRVADWTLRLAQRLGLSTEETSAAVRAAHLHGIALLADRRTPRGDTPPKLDAPAGRQEPNLGALVTTPLGNAHVALHVSERWDGTGAPAALAGDAIPIGARLVAVADAFDQLVGQPAAGTAVDPRGALAVLRDGAGRAWDPWVVAALGAILADVAA